MREGRAGTAVPSEVLGIPITLVLYRALPGGIDLGLDGSSDDHAVRPFALATPPNQVALGLGARTKVPRSTATNPNVGP